jgi:OHCU decarboxylase
MTNSAAHAGAGTPVRLSTAQLLAACGSERWAREVAADGPFDSPDALLRASERAFARLERRDWLEAFAAHARIGEPRASDGRGSSEQAGVSSATPDELAELRAGNDAYEARFGHVFLIRAAGRDTRQVLAELTARLGHSAAEELRIAAGQQREITALRLRELLAG